MTIQRISPEEAHRLIEDEGYVYVDVRSIPEFENGHPSGAYNVPIMHMTAGGMRANPDFLEVMQANFPKESQLIVGCKAGGRSLRAAQQLASVGYQNVVDQCAGFAGATDPFGQVTQPGWQACDLPTSIEAPEDHTYTYLVSKKA